MERRHENQKNPSVVHSIPWLLGWASLTVVGPVVLAKLIYKTMQVMMYHLLDQEKHLHGKVVLLTGASSGLGESLAHALYKRGCRLILASRNVEALEKLKNTLVQEYNPPELHIPMVVKLDLEDLNSIPGVVADLLKTVPSIDVLINNAGISYRGEVASTDISVDLKVMLVNYLGQVALTKAVLKNMITNKTGHIIGVSSVQSKLALPSRSCYSSSKHALQGFLDSLRSEVSCHNIHVTVVCPGYINTNLSLNAITSSGDVYGVTDDSTASGMCPDAVARRIVRCLVSREEEVLICPWLHRFLILVRVCAPSLYFYIMKWRFRSQKTSPGTKEKAS